MTGVDADLATLRETLNAFGVVSHNLQANRDATRIQASLAALSRVEAELSRLREDLDALNRERDAGWRTMVEQRDRAEAAEARLGEEHAEKMNYMRWYYAAVDERNAAHRECARLQQALDAANATGVVCPECGSDDLPFWRGGESPSWECPCVGVIFDPNGEALAGPDAAACEHDWIWPANVVCAKCGISGGDTPADSQEDKT